MTSGLAKSRRYGRPPYRVVLVHGGPGAPGSLAPVARELSRDFGVLEPWQSARTVRGQVEELSRQIRAGATPPVVLVGHSWGAWLALLFADRRPEIVRRLILVGSGPFRAKFVPEIARARRSHLTPSEWREFQDLGRSFSGRARRPSDARWLRWGELAAVADSYARVPGAPLPRVGDPTVYRSVWAQADAMRRSGALYRSLRRLRPPITVVHGKADPHPARGVVEPLRQAGLHPHVVLLPRCGHEPWWERSARATFFAVLRTEIRRP